MNTYYQNELKGNNQSVITDINETKNIIDIDNSYNESDPFSSTIDLDSQKVKEEAENLLKEGKQEIIMREKLMFQPQSVNLFMIYRHFFEPIDYFFLLLAVIGSIGAGICTPALFCIQAENFGRAGNTQEVRNINVPPQIKEMIIQSMYRSIRETFNRNIKKQLIFGAISFVSNFLCLTFWMIIGSKCSHKLKKNYFTILLSQEQGWFDSFNTYELATKVQGQIDTFEQGVGIRVGITLFAVSQCITGFVVAFILSLWTALVILSVVPIVVIIYIVLSIILRKGIIIGRKTWENAGGMAEEVIYNIKTVASFANFEYELKRFYEKVEIVYIIELKNTFILAILNGFIVFFLYLCLFISFIYGRTLIRKVYNIVKGRDTIASDIFATGLCILIGITSIHIIEPNIKGIQESCSAASDYFNIYKRKSQMDLSKSIEKPPISQIQGRIEFRGVNFYYPSDPTKRLILNNLNLDFQPGKKIALLGESGCGKSTTVNLIERLYDITGGQLLIDGIEIYKYDLEYLRSFIGYVQQEPVLFNTSIRENIIFGREEYLSSIGNIDELVQNACDESYSSEFINNLSEGLDYVVGIKGSKLSGGQRQRISIARAIISKPKILILDEATSSLDNKSEKDVQIALDNISLKNTTTIIIAHRLSSIRNADLIYVMKDGKVLEHGTHEQLLNDNKYYAGLVRTQLAQEELENLKQSQQSNLYSEMKRKRSNEEIVFENRDNANAISEKDFHFNCCAIFRELKNYKLDFILGCLGALIIGIITPVIGYFMSKTLIALNSQYQTKRYDQGLKYAFIFLAFALLFAIGNWLSLWKFVSLGLHLSRIYRKRLMEKYLSFHLSYYDVTRNSPGALLTRISINTIELNKMINDILGVAIICSCLFIVTLIMGLVREYRLYLIHTCFMPIIVISNVIRRQSIQTSGKHSIMAKIETGAILSECVTNSKTVFCYNFQRKAIQMYTEIIDYIRRQIIRDSIIMGLFMAIGSFCYFAANACIYAASKRFITNGSMDTEDMSMVLNICNTSLQGIINSLANLGNIRKAIFAFKSIYSTLKTKSMISPFPRDNLGKQSAQNLAGKIELRNVSFSYPTRPENKILKNVSLIIYPGQKVALVGSSGSGKSTIIQLLNRFYDIEEGNGEILIDDINIKDYNLYELRKKIGYVSQEPSIFKVSPLENVRYGRLDATDGECIEAARKANIMSLFNQERMNKVIDNKNKGINCKKIFSDPEGTNDLVSGGEKQRLCIARTFLKNPTILLLDEPTSSLDKQSEIEVEKSLEKLANNRTSVCISHRLDTIKDCDKIFVMNKGKIIEEGTHNELINLKSMYYTLYKYS